MVDRKLDNMHGYIELFKALDLDDDQVMSVEDIRVVLRSLGQNPDISVCDTS